jgi:Flp pilus assembly protein TadD
MRTLPARLQLANDHIDAGRDEQARAILARALAADPDDTDANSMICYVLRRLGRYEQALFYARRALTRVPADPNLLTNLGNLLMTTGDFDGAREAYSRAVASDPGHAEARVGLSNSLNVRHRYDEAEAACRAGLERHPGYPKLLANLGVSLLYSGRAREAVRVLREGAALHPDDPKLAIGVPHTMNYAGDSDPADVLGAHRAYGVLLRRMFGPPGVLPARTGVGRLRVGFMSGDLRAHACAFFIEPLLEHLDRAAFEPVCYSTALREDATSARLRSRVGLWRSVAHLDIHELVRVIRGDRVDVLVELSGLTDGHRLPALHLRCAPVQATYFGYPNTTGVQGVDRRIVDSITDPPGEADALAVERLARLDPCFLCYRPLEGAPAPGRDRDGAFTFGSFNNLAKLDDLTVDLWAVALRAAPGSRLFLKNQGLATEGMRALTARRFEAAGIDPARLELEPPGAGAAEMLGAYARMDAMLDSFPYHGTTTTCEALFMGVPVVTLMGRVCAARVSGSILAACGRQEWAAATPEAFAGIAGALAAEGPRDAGARLALRGRFLDSPACDAPAFARRFGALLRDMRRAAGT